MPIRSIGIHFRLEKISFPDRLNWRNKQKASINMIWRRDAFNSEEKSFIFVLEMIFSTFFLLAEFIVLK